MIGAVQNKRMLATFLSMALVLGTFGSFGVAARGRYSRRHHHSRAKGALIGGGVGLLGGALIGGRKGALIGAGAGAGTGYLIQRHRNHRRHRRYYRHF
jgi:osmotically inducible lipoprotein OsmB